MNIFQNQDRTGRYEAQADCRFCKAEHKACGRGHYEVLAHEWRSSRPVHAEKMATEKQLGYLTKLVAKKSLSDRARSNHEAKIASGELTAREASAMIDEFSELPWQRSAPAVNPWSDAPAGKTPDHGQVTEDGMYQNPNNGEIYKVQIAKQGSGHLYAKKLTQVGDDWAFEYVSGLIRSIRADWKMTLEQAKKFGQLYGVCCRCGAALTDEDSIEAGIGPICAGKF